MSDPVMNQVNAWRAAYAPDPQKRPGGGIEVSEEALKTAAPFPSLYANDFIVYIERQGTMPEIARFVRDISREMAWAYDNWAKAQRDGDVRRLLLDLITGASGPGDASGHYGAIQKYLVDYAKANNIRLGQQDDFAPWETLLTEISQPVQAPGTVEITMR